jgi:hypothetical protein
VHISIHYVGAQNVAPDRRSASLVGRQPERAG